MGASLVVHASAAVAAMLLGPSINGATLELERPAGSSGRVQLLATMSGPEQPFEQLEPLVETKMLITPQRAEVARRLFVQASTAVDLLEIDEPGLRRPRPSAPVSPTKEDIASKQPQARRQIASAAQIGSGGETPPRLVRNAPPVYPPEAVANRWEGTVVLRLFVTAEGRVGRVEIVQSSGHAVLDGTAAGAVQGWQFAPATRGGYAVASVVRLPVRFALW